MPLHELLKQCFVFNVYVPNFLLVLEVENQADFCRYALQKYFLSKKFIEDIGILQLDYEEFLSNGMNTFFLFLERKKNFGEFTLKILPFEPDK